MSTARRTTSARRRIALVLGRLLVLSSVVSAVVLTQPSAAGASTASFQASSVRPTSNMPIGVAVADFDGDGHLDNVTTGNHIAVVRGTADGDPDDREIYELDEYSDSVGVGDFDADGHPDVVASNPYARSVSVLLGSADGTLGDVTVFAAGDDPSSVVVGDVNGDGDPDLAVTNLLDSSGGVSILLGGPGGSFGAPTTFLTGARPYSVAIGSFDGDSDPDLAVGNSDGTLSVLLGTGDGSFDSATSVVVRGGNHFFRSIAVGDFNGDSDPDLAVVVEDAGVDILLGAAGGTFAPGESYDIVGSLYDVAIGDFNNDDLPDLVVGVTRLGVGVLHGDGDGTFSRFKDFRARGTALSVAVGDFNSDHKLDIVAADYVAQDYPFGGVVVLLNTLDTTPPDTTINVGPGGPTNDATPTFTFTSSQSGSTFECRFDDADFSACSPPHTSEALAEGTHTFEVRATDASDNVDPTPASRTFTVDTVEPDTTITAGPEGPTNDSTPTFTFTSSEAGATFECRVGGGSLVPCTSPYTTDDLGAGEQTFLVRARDAAGNFDATPVTRSFTIDTSPPSTSITSGPDGVTGDSTPTFGFTSPDSDATFECRVDDAAFEACTTPHTTTELDDGEHVFHVRAIDSVGNVDPVAAARAFTVDTVAPDTTIGSGPTGVISDETPTFGWESLDGAVAHECRVDDEPFAACESPTTTDPLSDGQHTFELRAIDGGGNVDPTPATRTFTVDTEAPTTGITGGPSGLTNDPTPTFSFANADPDSTFECRVSPASFAACTSPYTASEQSDGEHTFQVRATDSAGNVESPAVGRGFTVDTTAPDTTIDSGPTGTIDDQTPTFGFSSQEDGATLECRVDNADFGPCTSPYTTTLLDNGNHTFEARATDAAGNFDPTPASRAFTVKLDITPPQTRIDSGPPSLTNQVSSVFTFSADETATFECKLDASSFAPCESGDSFGPLDDGSHEFAVRATDSSGNGDPTPATGAWIVDTTPPQTTILSGPSSLSLLSSKASFVFASSEGSSRFECRLDSGAWVACTNPRTYTGVRAGNHDFAVRAIDPAGNTDPTPAEATWFTLGLLPF